MWHRIFVLEVLRVICSDADLLRFLYDTYDANGSTAVVRLIMHTMQFYFNFLMLRRVLLWALPSAP